MDRITYGKKNNLGWFEPQSTYTNYKKIGTCKGMTVWGSVDDDMDNMMDIEVTCTVNNKYKRIMCLSISKTYFDNAWHVDITQVDSKFQGLGIAPMVYKYVMKKMGIILQAGTSQSPGGRYIWNTLAQDDDILMVGCHGKKGKLVPVEAGEDGEVVACSQYHKAYDGLYQFNVFAQYRPQ